GRKPEVELGPSEALGGTISHHALGPAVNRTDVSHQLGDVPARARRYRQAEVGPGYRLDVAADLDGERPAMSRMVPSREMHARIMPVRARPAPCRRSGRMV